MPCIPSYSWTAEDPRPCVFIATPCYGGMVSCYYMDSVQRMRGQYDIITSLLPNDSLLARARNLLIHKFMQSRATHLLFMDSDISCEPEHLQEMLDFNRDFVGGVYPYKFTSWSPGAQERAQSGKDPWLEAPLRYIGWPCIEDLKKEGRFITGNACGCGFMLLTRACLEKMINAYPETEFIDSGLTADCKPITAYALFDHIVEDKKYYGEDVIFCRRWKAIGGEIWLDIGRKLTHHGNMPYGGVPGPRYMDYLSEQGFDTAREAAE